MRTLPGFPAVLGAALTLAMLGACNSAPPAEPELPEGARRLLFIGNSLTYSNNLPGIVAEIALADGHLLGVASVAHPNTALIDYTTEGSALSRIAQGGWDTVILQQGPTTPGICRDTLVMATIALDKRIRAAGARTATLMTWPYDGFPDAFAWTHESAKRASDAVQGLFLPAGDAWVAAWRLDRSLKLYGPDGYHPSVLGSLLTALVVYEGVTGRDVRLLPSSIPIAGYSGVTLRTLQQAAHEAVAGVAPSSGIAPPGATSAEDSRPSC